MIAADDPLKGKHKHTREMIWGARVALDEFQPRTLRNIYYGQTGTDGYSYDAMIMALAIGRHCGVLGYDEIIDTTRNPQSPVMFTGVSDFRDFARHIYRQDIWSTQRQYVEVWCESNATAPILSQYTRDLGVPLQPCGGDFSIHATHVASERFRLHEQAGRPCVVIYVGDFNPKGEQIPKTIARNMRGRHGVRATFRHVAITPEQIVEHDLPSEKLVAKAGDKLAPAWIEKYGKDARTVEVEAMHPQTLIDIVRDAVSAELDLGAVAQKLPWQKRNSNDIQRRLA